MTSAINVSVASISFHFSFIIKKNIACLTDGRVSIALSHMIINYWIFGYVSCQLFWIICLIKCQTVFISGIFPVKTFKGVGRNPRALNGFVMTRSTEKIHFKNGAIRTNVSRVDISYMSDYLFIDLSAEASENMNVNIFHRNIRSNYEIIRHVFDCKKLDFSRFKWKCLHIGRLLSSN